MTSPGEPSLPVGRAGHPGPRWEGDGSLGGPLPGAVPEGAAQAAMRGLRSHYAAATDREYASFARRLGAWVVDEAAKTLLWATIVITVTVITGNVPGSPSGDFDLVALAPRFVLSSGYDWLFWMHGWTPGANLLGVRIVRADGEPPGAGRAAARVAGSWLSGAAFFVGYVWMVRSRHRQTWHDSIAGTYVVDVPREDAVAR
ncbi:MAG: RDD family protein [Dehalococcoidia bacterium]|nr:RDD family protein [Dehalococcoidia bacterium]